MGRRIVMLLVIAIAIVGCRGQDDAGETSTSGDAASPATDDAERPGGAGEEAQAGPDRDVDDADEASGPGGPDATVHPAATTAGRRVIRTAHIELLSEDPEETVDDTMRLAERSGGFVATTDLRRDEEDVPEGTITVRVPSADLLEVLRELEDLAMRATSSRIDERDVTEETSDLRARLTNLTAYEDELRSLLADVREDTSSPDDLLRIFERIREVRGEIDTIEGRLSSLQDQVALATITVRIEPAPTALTVADPTWQPLDTVRAAFTAAARGLSRVADAAIWLGVGVLPVLLVVALPILLLVVSWRRARRVRPASGGGASGGAASGGAPDPVG